jgi:hypothetical protein
MMASPNTQCSGKLRTSPAISHGRWPSNPREQRAIEALIDGPKMRHEIDSLVGCENGPDLIARVGRAVGFRIGCEEVPKRDRDGKLCKPGRYFLTADQRERALALRREAQAAPKPPQANIPRPTPRKRASGPLSKRKGRI